MRKKQGKKMAFLSLYGLKVATQPNYRNGQNIHAIFYRLTIIFL